MRRHQIFHKVRTILSSSKGKQSYIPLSLFSVSRFSLFKMRLPFACLAFSNTFNFRLGDGVTGAEVIFVVSRRLPLVLRGETIARPSRVSTSSP